MFQTSHPLVSIIIPAYNEAQRLPATLRQTLDHLSLQPYSSELILVDDGSSDNTSAVMASWAEQDLRIRTVSSAVRTGKGGAVRSGMRVALGKYLIFMDADLSYPLHHLEDLLSGFDRGYDVVIGSRSHPGSLVTVGPRVSRRIGSKLFNGVTHFFGLSSSDDTQCGFKGFTREAAEQLFSRQRVLGFAFDVELLYIARRLNLSVLEVPVTLRNADTSSVNIFRDGYRISKDLFRIAWRGWRRVYDLPARRSADVDTAKVGLARIIDRRGGGER